MSSCPLAIGEEHHAFRRWSVERGVQITGIEAGVIPGQGMGIYATRDIEENEVVLEVPLSAMLTIDNMPKEFVGKFAEDAPVQGIMAAYLMIASEERNAPRRASEDAGSELHVGYQDFHAMKPWLNILPSKTDIKDSLPLVWPDKYRKWIQLGAGQSSDTHISTEEDTSSSRANKRRKFSNLSDHGDILLTPCMSGLWNTQSNARKTPSYGRSKHQHILSRQESRLLRSRDSVLAAIPHADWETFLYYWLIINTRCFYYDGSMVGEGDPRSQGKSLDDNDSIAMMPFADYFNHTNKPGCKAQFDGQHYTFLTTKRHGMIDSQISVKRRHAQVLIELHDAAKGDELFVSYGQHPNDFLWAEYGFFLDENSSDVLYLDDIILNDLSQADIEELEGWQYLGNYQLFAGEVCYRTEMAACLKYMPRDDWRAYVYGENTKSADERKTAQVIKEWICKYLEECEAALKALTSQGHNVDRPKTEADVDFRAELCIKRWKQIKDLCRKTLEAYDH
ncbi:hypothetical protein KEM56_007554 [Ascosphaera pollenicola]|nr:hypothetical protein KEM56_007554 [Ascosphaera pollenicola]